MDDRSANRRMQQLVTCPGPSVPEIRRPLEGTLASVHLATPGHLLGEARVCTKPGSALTDGVLQRLRDGGLKIDLWDEVPRGTPALIS